MPLTLSSQHFAAGERIPSRFTCEGEDVSPHLTWSGAPEGTQSFVLLCDDPDAPAGTWHHWAVYDIPTDVAGLPEAYPADGRVGEVRQAVNDFGRSGYGGPCPPRRHGTHHYRFRLLALDVESLGLEDDPGCTEVEAAAEPHVIETAELVGTYSR
ncbi:MAG: YbhB/YbcL family Raf kinase inhibitor-like protein [Alphaproteobacteria bacterium]|nr:YbhB/YbcL family Raf kinase inhibitor-like protein [Alphaproteobacteria bacterium]